MNNNIKFGVIFDMDGVLIDTYHVVHTAHTNLLGNYGISFSPEDIRICTERPLSVNIKDWNEKYKISINESEYRPTYYAELSRILREEGPNPELLKLLQELEKNKVPKGIGTLSRRERAETFLKSAGLEKYFSILVAEEDVHNHKPSPDAFNKIAHSFRVPSERCVVIEDSYMGALAGKVAKMKVIGYLHKYNSPDSLVEADVIIKDFSEINYNYLEKMFE